MQFLVERILRVTRLSALGAIACGSFAMVFLPCSSRAAYAQLKTLSSGNADVQWRDAQLRLIDEQLKDNRLPADLKKELTAQRGWLSAWNPKAKDPKTKEAKAETKSDDSEKPERFKEPILDPNKLASPIRKKLFESKGGPTTADTKLLQKALGEHSGDIGLRQLQLHWIDQSRYRDDYWKEIVEAADRVTALAAKEAASDETKLVSTFAFYRKARALAHCLRGISIDSAKIVGADKLSEADRESMQSTIGDCWRQIENRVGAGRMEFVPLEIYCLRRDSWSGRALELLERHSSEIDQSAYLLERESILESLGWTKAATQQADKNLDRSRSLEIQFVPMNKKSSR